MKIRAIVALTGLAFSVPAFAVPFVFNDPAPSTINPAPAGQQSLQQIADNLFGPGRINVATDQSAAGQFSMATPNAASSIPHLFAEFTANAATQVFGIWFGTDTSNVVTYDLFLGGAAAGRAAGITITGNTLEAFAPAASCGSAVNCGSFTNALINATRFGFYFRASSSSPTYFTLDQLNPGTPDDRVVAFQDGGTTNWLFAYEDGTNFDYNDMAVKVESIVDDRARQPTFPVPEPVTTWLIGVGLLGLMGVARRRRRLE